MTSTKKPYLVRFLLKYSTIERYFDTREEAMEYMKELKDNRDLIGFEVLRKPGYVAA